MNDDVAMSASGFRDDEMLAIVSKHVGASISVIDRSFTFVYVSAGYAAWLGKSAEDIVGRTLPEFYGEHNFARLRPFVERALSGEVVAYERLVRDRFGRDQWRTINLSPWRDAAGNVLGIVHSALDVDELKTRTEALRVANQRLQSHMDNSPLAVIEFDEDLAVSRWSPHAENMFGWSAHDQTQTPTPTPTHSPALSIATLLGGADAHDNALRLAFARLHDGDEPNNRVECALPKSDGTLIHCEWFNSALTDDLGRVVSIMSLVQDVSERVQMAQQMRELAERDSLTGLLNRTAFRPLVERALKQARKTQTVLALLFIDLDGFKAVNDQLGHAAGDDVLREAARRLSSSVRATDIVARLGGDEFVVLLETPVDAVIADEMSRRILLALSGAYGGAIATDAQRLAQPAPPEVGASIGVAMCSPNESHIDSLFQRADTAMYDAKRSGKGCVRHALLPSAVVEATR